MTGVKWTAGLKKEKKERKKQNHESVTEEKRCKSTFHLNKKKQSEIFTASMTKAENRRNLSHTGHQD